MQITKVPVDQCRIDGAAVLICMYAKRGCSFFCASHVTDTSDVFLSYTQTICLAVECYASFTMFIAVLHQLLRPACMLWLFVFVNTGHFFVHSWYSLSLVPFNIDSSEQLLWKPSRCLCYWLHVPKKVRAIWATFSVCIEVDEWCTTAFHGTRYKFIFEVTIARKQLCSLWQTTPTCRSQPERTRFAPHPGHPHRRGCRSFSGTAHQTARGWRCGT